MNSNILNGSAKDDVPLGLGMALAQNMDALKQFAAMSISEQQDVIENAHNVKSSVEMREYVEKIRKGELN